MYAAFTALSVLVFAYLTYKQARQVAHLPWKVLLKIFAAIALFTGVFIIPVVSSPWLTRRPGVFFTVFFGGLVCFTVPLIVFSSRAFKKSDKISASARLP